MSVDDNKNMKRTTKIAFPEITFADAIIYIVPKYYKYMAEKDARKLASKIHNLYVQKTLTEYKECQKHFDETYNNAIHQKFKSKEKREKIATTIAIFSFF